MSQMTDYLPHQLLMIRDGFPSQLFKTKEQRKAWWEANPPKTFSFTDHRIEADKKLRAQQKKEATAKRISKMLEKKGLHPKASAYNDSPDADDASSQEANEMPRLSIIPYDAKNQPIMRAVTSIKEDANEAEIDAQIQRSAKRGGAQVARVEVKKDGVVLKEWKAPEGATVKEPVADEGKGPEGQAQNGPPAETTEASGNTAQNEEEANLAKRKKSSAKKGSKKAAKKTVVKKAPGAGGLRAGSKQEMLYNMLTRKSGCTTEEAVKATGWKSCGLTVWGKKFGLKISKEKNKNGVTHYFGA